MNIKRNAEDIVKLLRPIAFAVDKMQSNTCKISDAVYNWKILQQELPESFTTVFEKRYRAAIKDCHLAAFILSPRYGSANPPTNIKLTALEYDEGVSYIENRFSIAFNEILLKFKGQISPFRPSCFISSSKMTDFEWWKSIKNMGHENFINNNDILKIYQLMTANSSTAAIERSFSKFGLIHSKLRSKLGVEKAGKLVFISQQLND